MTALDWGIVAFALVMAIVGYQAGLIVGAMSLGGFLAGAFIGARLGPALLEGGSESPYAPLTALLGAVLLGAMLAIGMEGLAQVLRQRVVIGPLVEAADLAGGATLLAALGLGVAWLFGAVALNAPALASLRPEIQRSAILRSLNELFPPSGPLLNVLNRIDPRPEIEGPRVEVGPPGPGIRRDPEVRAAGESVVRVLGTACGLGVAGSGWVAAPDLVVTNAHVVAGQEDTMVSTMEGAELDATAVHYEPRNDLAILRVDGLGLQALPLVGRPRSGTEAAVLGYSENEPFTISPARIGSTGEVVSQDSYGRGPVRREMTPFRGAVRSGNSGGPAVDEAGAVLTTVFAASTDGRGRSGLGVPNEIVAEALESVDGPTSTGPCAA